MVSVLLNVAQIDGIYCWKWRLILFDLGCLLFQFGFKNIQPWPRHGLRFLHFDLNFGRREGNNAVGRVNDLLSFNQQGIH